MAERETAIAAGAGGAEAAQPVMIVSKRKFAGYWEYMLEEAIFTAPPMANFGGAALISPDGRLIGIGSLIVGDALPEPRFPGNMFVPIDLLKPIMADLMTMGRSGAAPRPWLGITSEAGRGRVLVARVAPDSPAQKAGVAPGDLITAVAGKAVRDLSDFYETLWATGPAGTEITLTVVRANSPREITVKSIDRLEFLRKGSTY
jgi:S1-C subfamily serine protease